MSITNLKSCAILQSSYIPWKGYFDIINSVDEFIIYDCVQYTKSDWRNRNKIKTSQGANWITIPVKVPNGLNTRIDEVVVANDSWRKKHWRSITENYSKCEYFSLYFKQFEEFFLGEQVRSLSSVNEKLIRIICQILDIPTNISQSTEYELSDDRNSRILDICSQVGANIYLSGPAAKEYIDETLFSSNGVKIKWMDYSNYPEYSQRFSPFVHGVSVIDLIFNEGPKAKEYMKSYSLN